MRLAGLLPEIIKRPVRRLLAPYRLRRSWLVRTVKPGDDHLATYWNAETQPNRQRLIQMLLAEFGSFRDSKNRIDIVEYGSHVGLNLKMLREGIRSDLAPHFYAVEPNAEAVEFLRENLPFVEVLHGEDEIFCAQQNFPPAGRYLSFVNSVFYAMEPHRVKVVLAKLCSLSDTIVVGESISNLNGDNSRLRNQPECFEHPYRRWFDELGFEIVSVEVAPEPRPQLNGFFVAHRRPG